MEIPRFARVLKDSVRLLASLSVRTAVGSSIIINLTSFLVISLAISINCLWPTGISETSALVSMFTSRVSSDLPAIFIFSFASILSNFFPKILDITEGLVSSISRVIFSATVNPGIKLNSWCTIPMPAFKASIGFLKSINFPSK